jgi:hypothetical protein
MQNVPRVLGVRAVAAFLPMTALIVVRTHASRGTIDEAAEPPGA